MFPRGSTREESMAKKGSPSLYSNYGAKPAPTSAPAKRPSRPVVPYSGGSSDEEGEEEPRQKSSLATHHPSMREVFNGPHPGLLPTRPPIQFRLQQPQQASAMPPPASGKGKGGRSESNSSRASQSSKASGGKHSSQSPSPSPSPSRRRRKRETSDGVGGNGTASATGFIRQRLPIDVVREQVSEVVFQIVHRSKF